MQALPQFDYIFALGLIFAFLDAYGIGANDVANSFATSVSSRSLTLMQACFLAAICEFLGALLLGARVTNTIKDGIINIDMFTESPSVLMLAMWCALVGSSSWVLLATRLGLPVSTTHSIIGAIVGVGIAANGGKGVKWGYDGVARIVSSWVIAPFIAGAFALTIFMLTKYFVLKRQDPLRAGFIAIPIYFGFTSGILTMMIVWKGAPGLDLDELGAGTIIGAVLGVAGVVAAICIFFFVPYLHRRLVREDPTVRWYHFFLGPYLWKAERLPFPGAANAVAIKDYFNGGLASGDMELGKTQPTPSADEITSSTSNDDVNAAAAAPAAGATTLEDLEKHEIRGPWILPSNIWIFLRYRLPKLALRGMQVDVVNEQARAQHAGDKGAIRVAEMHARAAQYDNKTEHLYSFLQVLTACTASFAHGANDVSNAVGPLVVIYQVWKSGVVPGSKSDVPVWILAFGGAAIVIGLSTYGYNIMRNLGNRLTPHSPTRGFSMELGAALTVVLATRLNIPVSTTHSITGATVAVGMANGDLKVINWKLLIWIFGGWIITLPIAGTVAGCLMAIIVHAPRFGMGV
ncbi:phosphate transporter [Saitoella complicata NRRL Y-17804]|uniref:phosphate transporter n=1 Tax=Saitoella complicata (strain BCRC 22490 / CBS 7301 / JCM 7358 / NBRC 10748 / NRRL Y-17804) TaxID=698492 RepID=UPI000867B886|nr:phosphate transporter [Saitoella complicata NRRL Y-17804]ODQ51544.1 phosphate transporter [Saitoella complicata NRRL Y-17804]